MVGSISPSPQGGSILHRAGLVDLDAAEPVVEGETQRMDDRNHPLASGLVECAFRASLELPDTGVFAGPEDTGTDPLDPDTGGGGRLDGRGVELGVRPLQAGDDHNAAVLSRVVHAHTAREAVNAVCALERSFRDRTLAESRPSAA